jgi:uncharacterized protein DUF2490
VKFPVSPVNQQGLARTALVVTTVLFVALPCAAQSAGTEPAKQLWGTLNASFELGQKTRLTAIAEKHNGEEESGYAQEKIGVLFSYRMSRIGNRLRQDVDKENQYNLSLGVGYEFLTTNLNGGSRHEHRLVLQATPKYAIGLGLLAQDRNRTEFRWNGGTYNFRYRNRLTIDRAFKIWRFRFSPFVAGELFWDRNHHSWNENHYAFGVDLPYKKSFVLKTYYLHQNCTTCATDPLNVAGISANFFFDWPMKR